MMKIMWKCSVLLVEIIRVHSSSLEAVVTEHTLQQYDRQAAAFTGTAGTKDFSRLLALFFHL